MRVEGRRKAWLMVLALLFVACTDVTIENDTDRPVRVMYWMPDRASMSSATVPPGESFTAFSEHGGRYTVQVVQDDSYHAELNAVRQEVSESLFGPVGISADRAHQLAGVLHVLDTTIERNTPALGNCSGSVADFTSATVTIRLDTSSTLAAFSLTCPTTRPSQSPLSFGD